MRFYVYQDRRAVNNYAASFNIHIKRRCGDECVETLGNEDDPQKVQRFDLSLPFGFSLSFFFLLSSSLSSINVIFNDFRRWLIYIAWDLRPTPKEEVGMHIDCSLSIRILRTLNSLLHNNWSVVDADHTASQYHHVLYFAA